MKTVRLSVIFLQANNLLKEIQANTESALKQLQKPPVGAVSDTTKKDQSLLDLIGKDTTKPAEASTREEFTLQNPLVWSA